MAAIFRYGKTAGLAIPLIIGLIISAISTNFWILFADEIKQYPNLHYNFKVAISMLLIGIVLVFGSIAAGVGMLNKR